MLQDCLDIFEQKYREKGERLILDNYELKEGTYRIVIIDGEEFNISRTVRGSKFPARHPGSCL